MTARRGELVGDPVLRDVAAARRCADRALLRRDGVVLIVRSSR
jgi:hypothetical protein